MTRAGRIACTALGLLSLAGCMAPGADIHLEPLFARFVAADGARETEALFGLYHRRVGGVRRRQFDDVPADASQTTIGPLWSVDRETGDGLRSRWRYLVPLGYARDHGDERSAFLVPVFVWRSGPKLDGSHESQLLTIWGWVVRSNDHDGNEFGWFPFYGDIESFSIFDRVQWVLWPFWVRIDGSGSTGRHVLFPIFGWVRGTGKNAWRVWPLVGHSWHDGSYDRWFFLWPIFHLHRNRISKPTPELKWMVWPLLGRSTVGTYSSTTVLWPFLGYAEDERSGFWGLDFPFPFVRLQTGPDGLVRRRFWPLFSYLHAGSLEAWDFLWPIIRYQRERYTLLEKDSFYVFPFWHGFREVDQEAGVVSRGRKLWPLFQHQTSADWERGSFPTLDPFQRNELVDRHFAWLWKVWEWEAEGERHHARSIAGLVHDERDERESRTSFSALWSSRTVEGPRGRVRERSLLFGLLRWRVTEDEGFDMLGPAFPGPGWPAEWSDEEPAKAP